MELVTVIFIALCKCRTGGTAKLFFNVPALESLNQSYLLD